MAKKSGLNYESEEEFRKQFQPERLGVGALKQINAQLIKVKKLETDPKNLSGKDEKVGATLLNTGKKSPNDIKVEKSITDKTGDGLNSNIIKLFKLQKETNKLTKDNLKGVLDANRERRQYRSIGTRVKGVGENIKDFFTMRGFLDKTGIVKRGTGGWASDMLDRNEEIKKRAKNRNQIDNYKNLVGESAALKKFEQQERERMKISERMVQNDTKIKEYRTQGFNEKEVTAMPESKDNLKIAERLKELSPSLRHLEEEAKASKESSSGSKKNQMDNSITEKDLETENYQDKQIELLTKIAENTADGGKGKKGGGKDGGGGNWFSKMSGGLGKAGDSLKSLGIGIIAISAALWVASKAFNNFAKLDWGGITKGLVVLGGLVLAAVGLSKMKNDILKGALVLGVLDLAVWGMSKALENFASLDWSTIGKGFVAIAGIGAIAAVMGAAIEFIVPGAIAIGALGLALIVLGKGLDAVGAGMDKFVESLTKMSQIDALNLALIGPALGSVAVGMAAMGAGSVAAGIGNLVGKLLNFGGPSPMDQIIELGKQGAGVKAAADGIAELGPALKGLAGIKKSDMDAINAFPWDKATKFVAANGAMKVDGNTVYNASKANEDQKAADKGGQQASNNTVVAPTINNKSTQNNLVRSYTRDEDTSIRSYYRSRFA
jgi:hypothetical protein